MRIKELSEKQLKWLQNSKFVSKVKEQYDEAYEAYDRWLKENNPCQFDENGNCISVRNHRYGKKGYGCCVSEMSGLCNCYDKEKHCCGTKNLMCKMFLCSCIKSRLGEEKVAEFNRIIQNYPLLILAVQNFHTMFFTTKESIFQSLFESPLGIKTRMSYVLAKLYEAPAFYFFDIKIQRIKDGTDSDKASEILYLLIRKHEAGKRGLAESDEEILKNSSREFSCDISDETFLSLFGYYRGGYVCWQAREGYVLTDAIHLRKLPKKEIQHEEKKEAISSTR